MPLRASRPSPSRGSFYLQPKRLRRRARLLPRDLEQEARLRGRGRESARASFRTTSRKLKARHPARASTSRRRTFAQGKLVRVISGEDLRCRRGPSLRLLAYLPGKWEGRGRSPDERHERMFYIRAGLRARLPGRVSERGGRSPVQEPRDFYHPERARGGIRWDDPVTSAFRVAEGTAWSVILSAQGPRALPALSSRGGDIFHAEGRRG